MVAVVTQVGVSWDFHSHGEHFSIQISLQLTDSVCHQKAAGRLILVAVKKDESKLFLVQRRRLTEFVLLYYFCYFAVQLWLKSTRRQRDVVQPEIREIRELCSELLKVACVCACVCGLMGGWVCGWFWCVPAAWFAAGGCEQYSASAAEGCFSFQLAVAQPCCPTLWLADVSVLRPPRLLL